MDTFGNYIQNTIPANRSLLLGNGYSIAASTSFAYASLLECAQFSTSSWIKNIFNTYNTCNFELVLEMLMHAHKINFCSGNIIEARKDIDARQELTHIFIKTLMDIHPNNIIPLTCNYIITKGMFFNNGNFLSLFSNIFTLNYDLLLYWSILDNNLISKFYDGFNYHHMGKLYFNNLLCTNIYFLHGALHLRQSPNGIAYKIHHNDVNILNQLGDDINNNIYPIIVFEGTDEEKINTIMNNNYLFTAYNSFSSISNTLFTYGFSFNPNDNHILEAIKKSSITQLYVGIYGSIDDNKDIVERCNSLQFYTNLYRPLNPININYYDTSQMTIW